MSDFISGLSVECLKIQRLSALLSQKILGHLLQFDWRLFIRLLALVLVTQASNDIFYCYPSGPHCPSGSMFMLIFILLGVIGFIMPIL